MTGNKAFSGKKVLFTSHRTGFANTFNKPLIALLKDGGAEVHYASNGEEPAQNCDKDFRLDITRNPFSIGNIRAYGQLKKIIQEEGYDLIHCHTPTGGVLTRLAAMGARKRGTKVIYTAHGFHFFRGASLPYWFLYYPIEKALARLTDLLLVINQEDYEIARKDFKTKVKLIRGVGLDEAKMNIKFSKADRIKIRRELGLKANDYVVIYPAELSVRKRQIWLLESVAGALKNRSNLHILLPGRDNLGGKIQSLVKRLGVEHQVHVLGFRKDIPLLLRSSNLAISTSSQEGLPVNIMEAMHVGLPVLATKCRGSTDLLSGARDCYLIDKNDRVGFRKQFERLSAKRLSDIPVGSKLKGRYYLKETLPIMKNIYMSTLQ